MSLLNLMPILALFMTWGHPVDDKKVTSQTPAPALTVALSPAAMSDQKVGEEWIKQKRALRRMSFEKTPKDIKQARDWDVEYFSRIDALIQSKLRDKSQDEIYTFWLTKKPERVVKDFILPAGTSNVFELLANNPSFHTLLQNILDSEEALIVRPVLEDEDPDSFSFTNDPEKISQRKKIVGVFIARLYPDSIPILYSRWDTGKVVRNVIPPEFLTRHIQ